MHRKITQNIAFYQKGSCLQLQIPAPAEGITQSCVMVLSIIICEISSIVKGYFFKYYTQVVID